MTHERHGMTGRLTLVTRDVHGVEVGRLVAENLITNDGRALVASLFTGAIQGAPRMFIVIGTGGHPATVMDTALKEEVAAAEARVDRTARTVVVTATFLPLAGATAPHSGVSGPIGPLPDLAVGAPARTELVEELATDAGDALPAMSIASGRPAAAVSTERSRLTSAGETAMASSASATDSLDAGDATVATPASSAPSAPAVPSSAVASKVLREAGIRIDIAGKPVLYNRVTFAAVTRSPNMELTLSWEVTF